jgi:hypothetical protein
LFSFPFAFSCFSAAHVFPVLLLVVLRLRCSRFVVLCRSVTAFALRFGLIPCGLTCCAVVVRCVCVSCCY